MRDIERDIRYKKAREKIANAIRFYSKNPYMIDILYISKKCRCIY